MSVANGSSRVLVTFGAAVAMDGPYQDELRDGVRDITKDVEDVEAHGGWWRIVRSLRLA